MSTFLPVSQLDGVDVADWLVLLLVATTLAMAEIAHVLQTHRTDDVVRSTSRIAVPLLLIFTITVVRRLVAL